MNLAKNGPGISPNSVLEVKYGTTKKSRRTMGNVQGVRMMSVTAIVVARLAVGDSDEEREGSMYHKILEHGGYVDVHRENIKKERFNYSWRRVFP